ncbi:Hypothetical protein BFF96_1464 [Corynebacterium pseudotuberculosis]|nr:Hypothetical protein BFF96_1464 [Corynebacterium pseudotuberculosis]
MSQPSYKARGFLFSGVNQHRELMRDNATQTFVLVVLINLS